MQLEEELRRFAPKQDTLLTIGVFDGVHLGHRHLIDHLKRQARSRSLLAGVVTFKEHPELVLKVSESLYYLSRLEERLSLLEGLGVDLVAPLSFTPEIAQLGARRFVALLMQHLRMRGLVVGPDFAMGKGKEGSIEVLRQIGNELGFTIETVPPLFLEGHAVRSTAIREALARGDVVLAAKMLGRPFHLVGPVVHGDARGRTLGFDTANISLNARRALPADGVYATVAYVDDHAYKSVSNIGLRPTFHGKERLVEVHLLDFKGDLYQKEVKIEFVERLRPEKQFASADELKAQIAHDVERARSILG
ncbi:MAG: bifunctional riboflavin kinase/FAD synthetase [Dehalococcoidia bacterium]|nr:bifunctional riboflavin kinase/FAD synthetase [Dehalococcoidia bacterium]